MVIEVVRGNDHVVQVYQTRAPTISCKKNDKGMLERHRRIEEAKRHPFELEGPSMACECHFLPVSFGYLDLLVPTVAVKCLEVRSRAQAVKTIVHPWKRVAVFYCDGV